jgi:hypothetical protein
MCWLVWCRFKWIIMLLVTLPSPISELQHAPLPLCCEPESVPQLLAFSLSFVCDSYLSPSRSWERVMHVLKFKVTADDKIVNTKIPKPEIKTIRKCGLTNYLWKYDILFLDRKHIKIFNGLPNTRIQHLQSFFVIHNFHMIVLDTSKNVENDHWANNGFNNPLVLPLPD